MKKILILEDEISLCIQWQRALESCGFEVHTTHGAADALEIVGKMDIDLCIIDLFVHKDGAPVQDGGILFLGRFGIRHPARRKKARLIGVTGFFDSASSTGGVDYFASFDPDRVLQKPFSSDELVGAVKEVLKD